MSLVEQGYATPDGEGSIIGLQHLPDQQSVCVATSKGDVLLYNTFSFEVPCTRTRTPQPRFVSLFEPPTRNNWPTYLWSP